MKDSIRTKLDSLSDRLEEVNALLADPEVIGEQRRFRELSREYADIAPVVDCFRRYGELDAEVDAARAMTEDADPDIRPELGHLAYLETALMQQGLLALDTIPVDVLHKALDQFEGLVSNWAPRGLATLRSKMAVALSERSASGAPDGHAMPMALSDPPA